MSDKILSKEEVRGKLKPFVEILREYPEISVNVLNEFLKEEPVGINLFYKEGFDSWQKMPKVKIGSSSS